MSNDDEMSEIRLVSGRLCHLRMDTTQNTEGNRIRIFRFTTAGTQCVFHAATFLGSEPVFVAEGDRVELVIEMVATSGQKDVLVYAMRNLEDGDVYISHSMFQWRRDPYRLPLLSMHQQRSLLAQIGTVAGVAWLIFAAAFVTADATGRDGRDMLICASAVLLTVWFVPAVMIGASRLKWKLGKPNRRQRLLERVHSMLSLGSPLDPATGIYGV